MALKVGIPRSLFYYKYYPLWKTFFEELGAEIVWSDKTTKQILDDGVKSCVDEACLPVKLFHGHVLNIRDRVDYLFIPRFTSISRNEYVCPKFGGLPDIIRHSLPALPPLISTEVNLRKSRKNSFNAALSVGSYFTSDKKRIKNAYNKALEDYRCYRNKVKEGVLPADFFERNTSPVQLKNTENTDIGTNTLNITVIGHVYNLYDSYINMDMLKKLKGKGININTVDMVDDNIINQKAEVLKKRMFWNFGRKAVGCAFNALDRKDVDGIIYIMSFGCGVDSFVCDLIERKIRRSSDIPFIVLTLDEHSGEAGMDTRLEAFIDMVMWRKKDENYLPAYG